MNRCHALGENTELECCSGFCMCTSSMKRMDMKSMVSIVIKRSVHAKLLVCSPPSYRSIYACAHACAYTSAPNTYIYAYTPAPAYYNYIILRCAPHPLTSLLMLLLIRESYEDEEHACELADVLEFCLAKVLHRAVPKL